LVTNGYIIMTIFGIIGGIGSGKTLSMVYLLTQDAMKRDKKIMSNIRINMPQAEMMSPELLQDLTANLKNYSMGIDEAHNVMESRSSSNTKVKQRSHFILQSRHAGQGSLDIYYTTQYKSQVDKRLRLNTDVWVYPLIVAWEDVGKKKKIPTHMIITYVFKKGQQMIDTSELVYIKPIIDMYDTHEIVPLDL